MQFQLFRDAQTTCVDKKGRTNYVVRNEGKDKHFFSGNQWCGLFRTDIEVKIDQTKKLSERSKEQKLFVNEM